MACCNTRTFPWRGDRELKFLKQRGGREKEKEKKKKKEKRFKKKIDKPPVQPAMAAPGERAIPEGLLFCAAGTFPVELVLLSMSGLHLPRKQGAQRGQRALWVAPCPQGLTAEGQESGHKCGELSLPFPCARGSGPAAGRMLWESPAPSWSALLHPPWCKRKGVRGT